MWAGGSAKPTKSDRVPFVKCGKLWRRTRWTGKCWFFPKNSRGNKLYPRMTRWNCHWPFSASLATRKVSRMSRWTPFWKYSRNFEMKIWKKLRNREKWANFSILKFKIQAGAKGISSSWRDPHQDLEHAPLNFEFNLDEKNLKTWKTVNFAGETGKKMFFFLWKMYKNSAFLSEKSLNSGKNYGNYSKEIFFNFSVKFLSGQAWYFPFSIFPLRTNKSLLEPPLKPQKSINSHQFSFSLLFQKYNVCSFLLFSYYPLPLATKGKIQKRKRKETGGSHFLTEVGWRV